MTNKKGQAALEFLMTYGWAIIIIAVVLVVLYQWGVFNPQGNMRPTFLGFWGVVPSDFVYWSNGKMEFTLQNNIIDGDMNITCYNITYLDKKYTSCPTGPMSPDSDPRYFLSAGNTTTPPIIVEATDSGFSSAPPGASFSAFVEIDYVDNRLNESYVFRSSGTISGAVEAAE
jgi:hypothetical protein